MKKTLTIFGIVMLLMLSMVAAETQIKSDYVSVVAGSAEAGTGDAAFAFIQGTSDNAVRKSYTFPGTNSMPDFVGEQCEIGEYIVPIRCHTQWSECQRVFNDDYLKTSSSDDIDMRPWIDDPKSWYHDGDDYHIYSMYQCKKADPASYLPPQEGDGRFIDLSFDSSVRVNDKVVIKGTFYATATGPFVIEANIDVASQRPLAVISSDQSVCDGSYYYSGTRVNGVKGTKYDFTFVVKAPPEEGEYDVRVYTWTDCWKDGGRQIHEVSSPILVKGGNCNVQDIAMEVIDTYSLKYLFSPTTRVKTVLSNAGCSADEVQAHCGTSDQDKDGIPDGCDYCPQDKGVAGAANGCHPCFGMDPYSASAKRCYDTYGAEYGVPDRLLNIIYPVTGTEQACDGNTVKTFTVRDNGKTLANSKDCGVGYECSEDGDRASCNKAEEPVKAVADESYQCNGADVDFVVTYDDGTTEVYESVKQCDNGCESGACKSGETVDGGREATNDGDNSVVVSNAECSTDNECKSTEYCDPTGLCIAYPDDSCSVDTDCEAGYECELGQCFVAAEPECAFDSECDGDAYCYDGYCLDNVNFEEGEGLAAGCDDDQYTACETGGSVLTAFCIDGELEPLSNPSSCESGSSGSTNLGNLDVEFIDLTPNEDGDALGKGLLIGLIVGFIVLAVVGYNYVSKKKKVKGKRGKKR